MYDELIKRVRQVAEEVCDDYDVDPYIAELRFFVIEEAADAIEHMQKTILRLENELGIYDDLPMVDQREPPKEETC